MKNAGRYFLGILALMALLAPALLADTLELKDGRLLEGYYVGGSRNTVRFQTENRVEVLPTEEVLALTFSDSGPSASRSASARLSEGPSTQSSTGTQIEVPAGTGLLVRLVEDINSKHYGADSRFTAILEADLVVNGRVVAPEGSEVYGRLTSAKRGGRAFGRAELHLELTDLSLDGQRHPIITDEYELKGRKQGTLRNTGIGAGLGALLDGKDGAAKGAAAGFGFSLLSKGKQISLPAGTLIEFRLEHSFTAQTR